MTQATIERIEAVNAYADRNNRLCDLAIYLRKRLSESMELRIAGKTTVAAHLALWARYNACSDAIAKAAEAHYARFPISS